MGQVRRRIRQGALALLAGSLSWTLATAAPPRPQQPQPPASPTHPQSVPVGAGEVDINSASAQQLNALPGFGPAYTRRVIAGRPYHSKNQLVTRGVIPQAEYDRIRGLIAAHRRAQ